MQRIHFTAADLARTRLTPTLGPTVETALALGLLGRPGHPSHARWRSRLGKHLRSRSALTDGLLSPHRKLRLPEDLLFLLERSPGTEDSAERTLGLSARRVRSGVEEVWRVAIAPYWNAILGQLEVECAARGRIAMTGGIDQMLATLHSRIVWQSPVLEIPGGPSRDIHLDGAGLTLSPSMFLPHHAGIVIDAGERGDHAALVFSVVPDAPRANALWDEPDNGVQALGALVGRTRAAALRELTVARTTTQLAERLGISSAGASQHAAVLRDSGLITSHRIRNTVLHTATPLGMALLGSRGLQPDRIDESVLKSA